MVWTLPDISANEPLTAIAEGIVSDTLIATSSGWRPADSLRVGDPVLTFDHGEQAITGLRSTVLGPDIQTHWPLLVPAGALQNREDVILLPEQKVMIDSDIAEELFGEAFVLLPALSLQSWRGIDLSRPPSGKAVVQISFSEPQIIYASRTLMLSCPGEELAQLDWSDPGYFACSMTQARHLIACIMAEEAGAALRLARQLAPLVPNAPLRR